LYPQDSPDQQGLCMLAETFHYEAEKENKHEYNSDIATAIGTD
jgi:hypothetical protein